MSASLIVDFKNVTVEQSGVSILRDVNFELAEAESVYLVGKSGSGKSSLLKAIYAEAAITNGTARILNYDLRSIKRAQVPDLRRNLGMIFQDFMLFKQWTVANNLSFVLSATDWRDKNKIRQRVEEVLTEVNLLHYFNQKVFQLSGGEQQRLAIARSILNKPSLIVADEPTGNLDPDTSDEILYLLNKVSKDHKTAVILATHDYRLIDKFPARIFRCHDNNIHEILS
ncbi:MAG TPA: ATP-binding cassette domain-containing protein [Saprospiraceae bacterium]|nr:ATP-binding cassette domain-containing protein [Saprospiraceae bacterium]